MLKLTKKCISFMKHLCLNINKVHTNVLKMCTCKIVQIHKQKQKLPLAVPPNSSNVQGNIPEALQPVCARYCCW